MRFSFHMQRASRLLCRIVLYLWAGFFLTGPGQAQSISTLLSQGAFAQAQAAFEAQNPSDLDRLFFLGQVQKAQGQLAPAIATFRQVLQIEPNYLNARRELAHSLLLAGQYEAAVFHFETLLDIDPSPAMRVGYRRFLNLARQNQPLGFSGSFALLPSTNVNRGTSNSVFDGALGGFTISPDSQADSGTGVQLGLSGFARHVIDATQRLQLNVSLNTLRYSDDSYNQTCGTLSVGYDQITPSGGWSLQPYGRNCTREDNGSLRATGLVLTYHTRLTDSLRFDLNLSQEQRDHPDREARNGQYRQAAMTLTRPLSASQTLSTGLRLERDAAGVDYVAYRSGAITSELRSLWRGGLQTRIGFELGARSFDGIFPQTTAPRDDRFGRLSIGVLHPELEWRGLSPELNCSHSRNRSNVALYDFNATDCQLRITREF